MLDIEVIDIEPIDPQPFDADRAGQTYCNVTMRMATGGKGHTWTDRIWVDDAELTSAGRGTPRP